MTCWVSGLESARSYNSNKRPCHVDKKHKERDAGDGIGRVQRAEIGRVGCRGQHKETGREYVMAALGVGDEGPEEVVPRAEDVHDGNDGDDGRSQGEHDLPVHLYVPGAVDAGRFKEDGNRLLRHSSTFWEMLCADRFQNFATHMRQIPSMDATPGSSWQAFS